MEKKILKVKELTSAIAEYNPRIITTSVMDKLKESIKKFGLVQPIILNKKTNKVVGGNQRAQALLELYGGDYEVEVTIVDLKESDEKTLNLALNKIDADWDDDKLKEILSKLEDEEIKLSGFDEIDFMNLITPGELPNMDLLGKETGIRYELTFWFETEKEKDAMTKLFFNDYKGWKYSREPNAFLLKDMIDKWRKK